MVEFTPKKLKLYTALLTIWLSSEVKWVYPIHGHSEKLTREIFHTFKARCRIPLRESITVSLQELGIDIDPGRLSYQIHSQSKEIMKLLDKSLKIQTLTRHT